MFRYVIAGLLVVAMAGVAYAGHKPNHNPGGGEPAPPVYAIFDSDPAGSKPVGQLLGVANEGTFNSLSNYLATVVLSVTTIAGDERQAIISLDTTQISHQGRLFFTGDDCSGTAYIKREPSVGTPAINFSDYEATVFKEDLPNAPHVLYVAGTDVAVLVEISSGVDGFATCSNEPPFSDMQGFLAEVANPDLHDTYPPPYFIRPM